MFSATGVPMAAPGLLSVESRERFDIRGACFEASYSQFTAVAEDTGKVFNIDGTVTLGENIADNGAILLALEAYEAHYDSGNRGNGENGTDDAHTNAQLFFLGFAR
jgi:predicted metalloendopeptidase